jgi:hypothetical protein
MTGSVSCDSDLDPIPAGDAIRLEERGDVTARELHPQVTCSAWHLPNRGFYDANTWKVLPHQLARSVSAGCRDDHLKRLIEILLNQRRDRLQDCVFVAIREYDCAQGRASRRERISRFITSINRSNGQRHCR